MARGAHDGQQRNATCGLLLGVQRTTNPGRYLQRTATADGGRREPHVATG